MKYINFPVFDRRKITKYTDFDKVWRYVNSCRTKHHFDLVNKIIQQYGKKWGQTAEYKQLRLFSHNKELQVNRWSNLIA